MTSWKECTLESVCSRLSSGKGITAKSISEFGQYPVYGGNGIRGYTNKANFKGECAIIGRQGAYCGNVRYFKGDAYMTEHAVVVCANEDNCTRFLAYLLSTMNLGRLSGQSAQPGLSVKTLAKQIIRIPNKEIQLKCAGLLGSLDNKIEQNEKVNENLLQQAQAIFANYYADATNEVPFTSFIQVLGGGTPKTGNPDFWDGHIPFFTPKDVGNPYVFSTEKSITDAGLEHCNSRLYGINTTFVTARGTVGKVSLAGIPMAMNQSCYALASDSVDPLLVYFYALKAVDSLKHKASGAVFDAIVTRDFNTELVSRISSDDEAVVLDIIRPIMQSVHSNTMENIHLSQLRDSLLPRLMSGELDVSDLVL